MASPKLSPEQQKVRKYKTSRQKLRLRLQMIHAQVIDVTTDLRSNGWRPEEFSEALTELVADVDKALRLSRQMDEDYGGVPITAIEDDEEEDGEDEDAE